MHRVFVPALKKAKIEDLHWHDLRHTFASRMVMAGVPLLTVSKLLGHKTLAMTLRYAHLAPGHPRCGSTSRFEWHQERHRRPAGEATLSGDVGNDLFGARILVAAGWIEQPT